MDADNGFVLSPELSALRDQVGKIIREEIIPIEARIDPDAPEIPTDEYWPIARKVQAAGMWCMGAPREYGGGGLGTFDMCVLTEEMAQHRMGLYNPGCGVFGRTPPPVIYAGSEEQKRTYAGGT
ncbi:MAG: acyl-CoA dehydrogenase family protein, partial [Candidatus Binatus sp.]